MLHPPITLPEFRNFLHRLWPHAPLPLRLGLAISGGVDSMALSYLTRCLAEKEAAEEARSLSIHAFIVDHSSRPNSSSEALAVSEILKSFNFTSHVLPLNWGGQAPPRGFETCARVARYRALGKACVQNDVRDLLLAHHADDQAETVMMRLISGSGFEGLAGMREIATLPECRDIYGANKIKIWRPLLRVEKDRLYATCKDNGVEWFEDKTNLDPTYTRRNAIRSILSETPSRLPRALQRESLIALSDKSEARNIAIKDAAKRVLAENCRRKICTRTGTLWLYIPSEKTLREQKDVDERVLLRLLIEVAEMITPIERVESRSMFAAFQRVFSVKYGISETEDLRPFTAGGLLWTYEGNGNWVLRRQPHLSKELIALSFEGGSVDWSEWKLYDGRWWFRVRGPEAKRVHVRPLHKEDMKALRDKAKLWRKTRNLDRALLMLPNNSRFTVPVLVQAGDGKGVEDEILGLPTMGLSFARIMQWQVKFQGTEEQKTSIDSQYRRRDE